MNRNRGINGSQRGAIVLIVCVLITVIFSLSAYLFYSTSSDVLEAQMQAAADAAAIAGAEALCGTDACFIKAVENANQVLAKHTTLNTGSGAADLGKDPDCMPINAAGTEFDCTESAPVPPANPKNLKVKFERGWWYPGSTGKTQFWSVEADSTFQPPGLPGKTVANAFRIVVTRPQFGSLLTFSWLGNPVGEVTVSSTATAGETESMCIAPFAIPICALHKDNGEFQGDEMCAGDRIFTRADRYCSDPADNGDCGLYPSFEYGPCSRKVAALDRNFEYTGTPWNIATPSPGDPSSINSRFPAALQYDGSTRPTGSAPLSGGSDPIGCMNISKPTLYSVDMEGNPAAPDNDPVTNLYDFNPSDWTSYNLNRYDYSPPFFANSFGDFSDSVSSKGVYDNFGLVGLPEEGGLKPTMTVTNIMQKIKTAMTDGWQPGGANCAIKAKVGDKFYVLPGGLDDSFPQAEDTLWNEIINSKAAFNANPSVGFPSSLDTDIGTIEANWNRALVTANVPMRGDGICGSRRSQMNVLFNPSGSGGVNTIWIAMARPLFHPSTTVPMPNRTDFDAQILSAKGVADPWPRYVDPIGNWRLPGDELKADNISGPRYVLEIGPNSNGLGAGVRVTDRTTVWQVLVPVIADLSTGAESCAGMNGATRDPLIADANKAYEIVKFVKVNIYDVDMKGVPANTTPPIRKEISDPADEMNHNLFRSGLSPAFTPITLGDPGPDGWFFNDGSAPLACNLLRARVKCGSKLTTQEDEVKVRIGHLVEAPEDIPTPAP